MRREGKSFDHKRLIACKLCHDEMLCDDSQKIHSTRTKIIAPDWPGNKGLKQQIALSTVS